MLKEESKVSPMVSMTGESIDLIVAVVVEYRDNGLMQHAAVTSKEMTAAIMIASSYYSFFSSTAGFVRAAFRACQRMERKATIVAITTVTTNTHP